MTGEAPQTKGLRDRKHRETRLRIAEEGLRLFDTIGYDATTLEAVAEAAGVSPRTLYHYFKTKYDILIFWHNDGFTNDIRSTIQNQDHAPGPMAVAQNCFLTLVPLYETDKLATLDRIWNSTEALSAYKQLMYLRMEEELAAALGQTWPGGEHKSSLRTIAMMVVGTHRIAVESGRQPGESRPFLVRLRDGFSRLPREV